MSHTHAAVQSGSGDAQIVEEHGISDPHGEDDNEGTASRGRRWYHPPTRASPTHRPHGIQLHMVDGPGLAHPDSPDRLSVPLLVLVTKEMRIFGRLRRHSLDGATEWLNSEPLGPAELCGHVVLVDF